MQVHNIISITVINMQINKGNLARRKSCIGIYHFDYDVDT